MNCTKREDELIGYLIDTLSDDGRKQLEVHLGSCPQCQNKLESLKKSRGLLHQWDPSVPPSDYEQVKRKIMDNIKAQKLIEGRISKELLLEAIESEKEKVSGTTLKISQGVVARMVKKRSVLATAMAALILIALLLVMNLFTRQTTESVAWGNMIQRIEKIKFYKYRRTTSMVSTYTEVVTEKADVYRSSELGIRINRSFTGTPGIDFPLVSDDSIEYGSLSDNTFITLFPRIKKYTTYHLPIKNVYRLHEFFDIVTYIKMVSSFNHKKLDTKIIDGKKVVGIEVLDQRFGKEWYEHCVARVWIDVDTDLPVLYEYLGMVGDGTKLAKTVLDSFEWYEKCDAEIFKPDLSESMRVAEIEVGPINEETALLTLQRFSEIADGRYPTSLARSNALWNLTILYKRRVSPFYWEVEEFEWEEYAFLRAHLETTCMFYGELFKEDKDVVYHGKVVTADNPNLPLLRWKVSDDEYRVLFGDLRIENVSVAELSDLEANLNKPEDVE